MVLQPYPLCLARRRVQLDGLLARAFAGARIGARALTAYRQPAPVPHAAIRAEIHQALDVHGHLAPQIALDGPLRDLRADRIDLGLGQILDASIGADSGSLASRKRTRAPHAVDVRE